ncbi:MAG: helix-turn-helix domain-containing protein [Candidatus Kapaibacterium sp.]|nr:helix-turn-helix domain-containing protein [Ignavibacteria bacterium]
MHTPFAGIPGALLLTVTPDELQATIHEAVSAAFREHLSTDTPQSTADDLLTAQETARLLHITRLTLREMEKRQELLPVRIGRRVLYRRSDIDNALRQGEGR